MAMIKNAGMRAKRKALDIKPTDPEIGMMLIPSTTKSEAPMDAPDDTPVV